MRKQKECAEDSLIEALTPRQKKELSRDIAGVLSKSDQDLDQGFAEAVSDGRINIMDLEQRARDFLFKRLTKIENIDGYFKSLSPASVDVILRAAIESEMAPAPVILGLMGALEQMQGPSFLLSQGETSHCQLIVHAFAYPSDQSVIQLWLELLSKTHSNDIPIELLLNAIDHQSEEVVLSLIEVFQAKGLLNAFEKLQMTQMISKAALLGMSKVVWALEEAMPGVLKKRQGYGETLLSEVLSVDRCESLSIELIEYYRLNAPGFLMNPFASIASLTTLHFAFTTGASEAVLLALIKAQHSIDPLSVVSAIKLDSDASRGYLGAPLHLALSREAPRAVSLALLDCYQEDGAKFLIFNKNDGISLLECAMKHCTDSENDSFDSD